jgi:hypothetical protein
MVAACLAACGESQAVPTPAPRPTPTERPLQACSLASLPESGFVLDAPRSGTLSVGRYSPNGDIEAALVNFRFETGQRQVFTDLPASTGTATPSAAVAGPLPPLHDELVICDALDFADAAGASGFIGAFRQLRLDAGQQEAPAPAAVGDRRVAFVDHDQSFAGYPIRGAGGAEMAASSGSRLYSVSVFGAAPTLQTALAILRTMMGEAR